MFELFIHWFIGLRYPFYAVSIPGEGHCHYVKEAWDVLNAEDSTIMSIASSILEKAVIKVEDVKKDGDKRVVLYSLEADGHSKTRKAIVKKEERAWRVEMISDAR